MIKLERSAKPVQLSPALQQQLTDTFKNTGKSVWNLDFLKKALLLFSNDKCSYCEANINEESKYLEVEHFHHKDAYKDEVLEWENLLPSCKKCNAQKGGHDTKKEPIINPTQVDPKLHLKYWRYRIKGKDSLGKMTISVLDLNNTDRLVKKRYEIGNAIQNKLEALNELSEEYIEGKQTSTIRKNRIINGTKDLLREGLPTAIYSATSATIILTDIEYGELKNKLIQLGFWDNELTQLELALKEVAFELGK